MDSIKKQVSLISYSKELVDGRPLYVSSNCMPVKALNFEPAGYSFHSAALKLGGFFEEEAAETEDENVAGAKEQKFTAAYDSYSTKGKKKLGSDSAQQDHYALLGLGHLRYLATEDQIRKSYRETALRHHPDKQAALIFSEETAEAKQAKKDEIESHFKAIQEAYEVLIDPVKRRVYDSTDEFDDEIPADCAAEDFFKVFAPAFMRNGRWSCSQPIPSLGENNASYSEVDDFYHFWYNFKSWREFPHADEFEVEQAESRDHKRWMERQNAKLREKAKKEEYARVRTLVDNAYKRDPRILRRKDEVKAEKQRKKDAKILARKQQEEEAASAAEEEKRKREEEERLAAETALNQKKQKEKDKKLLRKEKTRLRNLSSPLISWKLIDVSESDVENFITGLDIGQLRCLCEALEKNSELERARVLSAAVKKESSTATKDTHQNGYVNENIVNGVAVESKLEKIPFDSKEKREKEWSKEEIEMLRKGTQKYPKGTSRRWEVISEYIGTGRSVEEILKATKTVLLQKPDSTKSFDSFLEKRKAAQSISSPLTTREEVNGGPIDANAPNGPLAPAEKQSTEEVVEQSAESKQNTGGSSSEDVWSAIQEKALIQALKAFPKDTNQRWERVAAAVPGKTMNQCKKKFAAMKESFRSKKTGN